ncbi:FUSC family protein [Pigmentiphaga sp.]|uniref:FUSC family protein n=1 Tax=Pigmentiphaga sp. TaxID=1977564 RepID=UPI0025E821F1|nr:FUSC family protein [Pigmentiphaga sp.]MBX6317028.1 FUSC family protein [Pigmentiphaga sp.]
MPFGRAQWLFAAKLFVAAMMAYALSVHLALPQSYWSVVTCCVVMNPTTGGVQSKAVYRFIGTLSAGLCALILAGLFNTAPLLLIAFAGFLACTAFAWAVLDRTPRAYGFQLYGVTLLLVAVASVDHPELMFDTAIARVLEIGVGIFCCWIVDSAIAPRSLGPALHQRVGVWLPRMHTWMEDVFLGRSAMAATVHDQQRSIADVTSLSLLVSQLRYDPMVSQWERECAVAIQHRLLRLMPMFSSIQDHVDSLEPERRARVQAWLARAWRRLEAGNLGLAEDSSDRSVAGDGDWQALVESNLRGVVKDVLQLWNQTRRLGQALTQSHRVDPALIEQVRGTTEFPLQPDFYMAGRVFLASALAYGALATLWWTTGWVQGPNATLLGMVAIGFFGHLDQAGKAIGEFGKFSVLAMLLAAVISYGLLPLAQDFPSLALVFALVILPLGAWAAVNPLAVLLLGMAFSNINLQARYTPWDFGFFLDSTSGILLGILTGYFCLVTIRHMGPAHLRERFVKLEKRDIASLAQRADAQSLGQYVNRALDRAAGMAIRMTADGGSQDRSSRMLFWLRLGIAVGTIRRALAGVGGQRRRLCEDLLGRIREELARDVLEAGPELARVVDASLAVAARRAESSSDALVRGLIGLKLTLFPPQPEKEIQP